MQHHSFFRNFNTPFIGLSSLVSNPGQGHCVVVLVKTLNYHDTSVHPGVYDYQQILCWGGGGGVTMQCVIPENIHTSPKEGIFSKTPPTTTTTLEIPLSFIHFFKCFDLTEPPTPQEIQIPSVGGVWIFSGTAQWTMSHMQTYTDITT